MFFLSYFFLDLNETLYKCIGSWGTACNININRQELVYALNH